MILLIAKWIAQKKNVGMVRSMEKAGFGQSLEVYVKCS